MEHTNRKKILFDISFVNFGVNGIVRDMKTTLEALLSSDEYQVDLLLYDVWHDYDILKLKPESMEQKDLYKFYTQLLATIFGNKKRRENSSRVTSILAKISVFFGIIINLINTKLKLYDLPKNYNEVVFRRLMLDVLGPKYEELFNKLNIKVIPWTDRMLRFAVHTKSYKEFSINTDDYDFAIFQTEVPIRVSSQTKKIIRHHDFIPTYNPDTDSDSFHIGTYAVDCATLCINQNSIFVCNSYKTQSELTNLFLNQNVKSYVIPCPISTGFKRELNEELLLRLIHDKSSYELVNKQMLSEGENELKRDYQSLNFKYIFTVGLMDIRKNYKVVIKALRIINANLETKDKIKYIIAGKVGNLDKETRDLISGGITKDEIIHVASPSFDELKLLISHSSMFVFPSFVEGAGMPPIEAMRCGVPVLSSNIDVHKEIQKNCAWYANPYDPKDFAEKIRYILNSENSQEVNSKVENGYNLANEYNEENTMKRWLEIFKELKS